MTLKEKLMPPRLVGRLHSWISLNGQPVQETRSIDVSTFNEWYDKHITPLFENAVEVSSADYHSFCPLSDKYDVQRALLIGIEPIKQESAEDLLRAYVDGVEMSEREYNAWLDKAKRLVSK